jgi:SPP1 gp7 family putative phage head morphogenesis protein
MVTYNKTPYELLLDFQTRLQGVGNSLAADIGAIISKTDKALLNTVINSIPSGQSSVKAQMRALEKMVRQIEQIRAEGFTLAERHFMDAGPEIAERAGNTVSRFAEAGGAKLAKALSAKKIDEILNYHPVDGKSISQWFHAMRTSDLERITQTVQRASVEGMSISKVVSAIRGTKENGYRDGILETTRQSASTTARTIVNGVASNSMLETCAENADAIDGIKFVATLDAKTCPFCGSFDGKIWKPDEAALVKRPPLHPNCRCTVIPHIETGDGTEGKRPAANADFDKLAEETYNRQAREKGLERRYEDLAPSTRLKYYYQAQKQYEKDTGKPAFSQVKGDVSFKDYFEGQPESFKRSWLGPKRYELYKEGKYNPMSLGNPDTGYRVPVEDLK